MDFDREGGGWPAARHRGQFEFRFWAGRGAQERDKAPKRKREIADSQRRAPDERVGGVGRGRAARGLVEQDLQVPAQRQHRAPRFCEAAHADDGKADPGEAEGGRADDSSH